VDPSGRIVAIAGIGDVRDLGMESLWWLTNMSNQAQEQVMNTLGAYEAFKASSPLAAHMAWTMEQDKEHTVTITVGQKEQTQYWAKTEQSGNYYTININPKTFLPYGLPENELWKPIYDAVTQEVLDIKANYDIGSAVWDELVSEAISLNVAVDAAVTAAQGIYDAKTGNPATAMLEAIASRVPFYAFFKNLANQQASYEYLMIISQIPFPFQDN